MEKITRTICYFYNHLVKGMLTFIILTAGYYCLSLLKINSSLFAIFYAVFSSYILCSFEIKIINVLGAFLDSQTSKLLNKYRMYRWEDAKLNDVDRFYKIGWTDDYLSDLLKYLNKKTVLPTKSQIDFYLKENGFNGTINTISLYELLVSQLLCLSTTELITLKHYIEIKDSKQSSYHPKFSVFNMLKSVIATILFLYTSKGIITITIGNATFNNISSQNFKNVLSHIPTFILVPGVPLIVLFILVIVSLSFYDSKHLRYAAIIHQALADAYSIKSKNNKF